MSKKKKQKTVVSYQDYKNQNGTVVSFSDFKKNQQRENSIREQQERMDAARERLRQQQTEKKRQADESMAKTKAWQQAYNDAKNSPNGDQSWQVYAAKMMSDTPGALKREQEREKKAQEKQQQAANKYWRDLSREATAAGMPEVAYATKQIYDSPVSKEDEKKYGSSQKAKQAKLNDYLSGLKKNIQTQAAQKENKAAVSESAYASDEQIKNRYLKKKIQDTGYTDLSPAEQYANLQDSKKSSWLNPAKGDEVKSILSVDNARKWYSNHPFKTGMDELEDQKKDWQGKVDLYNTQAEGLISDFDKNQEKPKQNWSGIFDMLEGWDEQNEETILSGGYTQQEKENADKTLKDLQGSRDSRKQEMLDKADVYFNGGFLQDMWMNDWENANEEEKEQLRGIMYDEIMPDRYEDRVKKMSQDQKAMFDAAFDEMLSEAKGKSRSWNDYEGDYEAYQSQARYAQKQLENVEKQIKLQNDYYDYIGRYATPEQVGFVQANDRGGQAYRSQADIERGVQTNDVHRIYSFINKGKEYQSWAEGMEYPPITTEYNYAGLMNDNEIAVFNDFYNQGRYDDASAFLEGLKQVGLTSRYSQFENIRIQEAAKTLPVMTSVADLMMKQANTYLDVPRRVAHLLGDKTTEDVNSAWYAPARQSEQIENTIANEIGGTGGKIYSNVMNSLSNLVRGMTTPGGGTSKLAQTVLGLGGFFLQVDQEATARYLKDNDYDTAQKLGALDAVFEVAEEFLPYEKMLGSVGKNVALAWLESSLSEFGQEFTGALVFDKIKDIIMGKNGEQERADEIFNQGWYEGSDGKKAYLDEDKGTAIQQARVRAAKEYWETAVENGLAGFMGGGLGGMYGTIAQSIGIESVGKSINNYKGKNGETGLDQLMRASEPLTNSQKLSQELQDKIDKGEKVSNYKAGQLAQSIQEEAIETLNKADATQEEIKKSMDALRSVAEITGQIKKRTRDVGSRMASQQEIEEAEGERIQGQREAVYTDPKTGKATITKIDGVKFAQDSNKQWHMGIQVTVNGEQRTVQPSELRMTNYRASEIVNKAAAFPELYSEGYTNLLLDAADNNQISEDEGQLKQALNDAEMVRLYAYAGYLNSELPQTSLSRELANDIWKQSTEEHGKNRTSQVAGANRQEAGRATFDGVEYGTEEYQKKVADLKLSKQTQEWMDTVAGIAQRAGIRADFTITDDDMTYGWEGPEGIGLNISGMNYELDRNGKPKRTGQKHHLLVTFGHEMTHWLQRNSMQGYNRLEQYVLKSYIADHGAEDLMLQLRSKMHRGEMLNLEDAISEFVANSCDQILGSEQVRDHIAKTDGKLFSQIKGFVKDLVNRFKNAIKGMDMSASSEARAMAGRMNELAKVWLGAYDEALSGYIMEDGGEKLTPEEYKGTKENTGNDSRYSFADMQKLSWEDQVDYMLSDKAKANDVMELAKKDEVGKYGINNPIALRHSVLTKMMRDPKMTQRSGHKMTKPEVTEVKNKILDPAAKITRGDTVYLLSNDTDEKGRPILLVGAYAKQYIKGGVIDTKSIYRRDNVTTLYGRYENGAFVPYDDAKIWTYKENANDILLLSPGQLGAETDVISAINKLTQKEEIDNSRKSKAQLENDYMAAVESGDEATQRAILDAAAEKNGYTMKVYHGTPTGGFTTFRDWSYFTENKAYADRYNHPSQSSTRGYAVNESKPMTYELYFNPGRLFDTRDPKTAKIFNQIRMEYGLSELQEDGLPDWTDGRDLIEYIEENDLPYDTIVLNEGADGGYGAPVVSRGESYVTRSNMIKSTDLVTYDDDGQVIPPSERFDKNKNDIRYSRAVEETKDLIAYHNLGPEQLMAVLRLGGFAMPSIAITRDNYVNDRYGDITVLFRKDTIDPKKRSANKVYGGDAWTPVYPSVEYKISEKKMDAIKAKISKLVPSKYQIRLYELDAEDVEKKVNSHRGNIVEAVKDNTNLMAAYLADKGQEVNYPMREKRLDGFNKFDNQQVIRAFKLLGEEAIISAYEAGNTYQYLQDHHEIVDALRDEMNAYWKEQLEGKVKKETRLKLLDKPLYTEDNFGASAAQKLIEAAYIYAKQGIKQELDSYALQDSLREQIEADEEGYENWLKDLLSGAIEKSGIRNNKGFFDRMGNRRSWETLHDPETLENVVRVMKAEADKGSAGFFSQSELLALGTKDFKSLDEIRKDKARLQHISDEEMSAAKTDIINRFDQLVTALADPRESNQFIERDRVYSAIADTVRMARSIDGIQRIMNQWRYNITAEQAQEIADLMVEISNLPTEYFEAKPKRGVGLDEIAKVLVPEGTDQELLDALDDQGINWEYYDGTSEDRLAKMNATKDVKFSRWTEDAMDVSAWMANATASTVQTEDERILLDNFRGMRIKMSLSLKKQMDYKAKIRQLEGKANLTTEQKSELTALRNRLEIEENKYARLEDEMLHVTNADGWAGMMYRENMLLKDYIQGKTQDQVRQTVEDMLKLVQRTQAEIEKDTADLKKLAEAQAVKTMRSFMGKTSLGKAAATLRKTYTSTMAKAEIEDRLAEIALKKASGQDITSDTEMLAQDLLDKMRGIRSDTLEMLRGTKFVIGQSLADELKSENSSIKELQSRLKGSGVKLVTGQKSSTGEIDKHSRISEQWAELREKDQSLPDVDGMAEIDKLHTIVDFIEGELRASSGAEQFNINFDEVAAMVRAQASMVTTYLVDDPKARAQITNLMKQIAELSKKTEKTAADMERLYQQMDEVVLAGQKAKGWTTILQRDVNEAIKYYNKTAKVAAETERNRVRKELIEKLRSDHAKDLIKQQEKFKEMIANDKKARELAEDNAALRNRISTVATRMANRIFAETDQKNVPEEAKALVRQVIDMLSKHDWAFRKVTYWDKQQVDDIRMRIQKMIANYGQFNPDTDLNWLVVGDGQDADTTAQERVIQDLINIETGLMEYRNAEGKGRISLADRKAALTKVQEAISEIWNVVKARSEAEIAGRKWQVIELAELMRDEMQKSKFKGERTGFGSKARNTLTDAVTYGNLTPEYFFKNLKNRAMDLLHTALKDAENRSGLEATKARERLAEIAEQNGFATWDGQEKHKIRVSGGREIEMTTEQIMALYATWLREGNQLRPEDTAHLLHGGFVLAEKEKNGKPGRQKMDTRPIRMSKDQLNALGDYLTDQQKRYVDEMVAYMSGELAELGNEASMRMYGIKKFTEQYYFPIKSWGGVLNSRSDAGISASNENRAAQQGFSKRVKNNASNAIEIGDFTPTAIKHVAGMITYNTVGPAIENLNKVLNQQLKYGDISYTEDGEIAEDDTYKQNMRAAFENAYGKQAMAYLKKFMKDMNGGVTTERTAFDKLLSLFKKNAVAGSLSVAAQQPLSYIRAAMMINPKYLLAAISPQYWKGSYAEMMKHSGIAVIKEMGKFDMNFGQTMQDWITPEGMESKAKKAWNKTTDLITGLPGAMDAMTWTRMWTAVKLEQMAQNKGMDYNSEVFMKKVAERFNELMRRTQVYDSVMTKSQNMRSQHFYAKTLTSFMAEPTLSLNVLADSFQNIKEKGGKATAIKAIATFLLSAAAQAGAKAIFGAGRSPDKKKNREENFYNKFAYNLLSEINPFGLIPGYRQIVETLTDGELTDDTMGMIAKASDVVENIFQLATGNVGEKGLYRKLEDSIGQMLQLATDIPAKNMMRDFRAMVNWFSNGAAQGITGDTYAKRETSNAVLKYQLIDTLMSNDLVGLINKKLGDAGYGTTEKHYYSRNVEAEKAGNQEAADQMKEYLKLKSTAEDPDKTVNDAIKNLYKDDDSLSSEERLEKQKEYGLKSGGSFIKDEYEKGNLTRKDAEKLYRQENPKASDKDVLAAFDKIDYEKRTGKEVENYSNYMPLYDAMENNKSDEIKAAVKHMLDNGYAAKDIKSQLTTKYKQAYLDAGTDGKRRIKDALDKAYKALGYTVADADKIVQGWVKEKKKTK